VNSLDPRVKRLPQTEGNEDLSKDQMDQLATFEVFVQPKEGKPFQHEGAVHAPNLELAFVLAKETFTRRFTCTSLWVVETGLVFVTPTTEGNQNIYEFIKESTEESGSLEKFEIFHLPKRGKQHIHFRTVEAATAEGAIGLCKKIVQPNAIFYNVWAIRTSDIRVTSEEERDLWITLPEKKFRDAAAYKGGDKLKEFLERIQINQR
jgi:ring-1,2-phenylacetyl-CoA epoxidase subunit PaaB